MNIVKVVWMCIVAAGAASQTAAWAHAGLELAVPAKDAQLGSAPADITLKFNEKLESGFSGIKVLDAAGQEVGVKKAIVDSADAAVLHAPLPVLKPGVYTVKWVAVGADGHRRAGDYRFTVK